MTEISKADKFLIEQIKSGQDQAWSQLINRYQGRLMKFARSRLSQHADSEDIVQDTFIAFLQNIHSFRHECNIETYLFTLLRRKIIDTYRKRSTRSMCLIQDIYKSADQEPVSDALDCFAAQSPAVSWYARKDEQSDIQRRVLTNALTELLDTYKKSLSFTELKIIESIFYCHLSNSNTAKLLNIPANRIAVIKHRCIKQLQNHIEKSNITFDPDSIEFEELLTDLWQKGRLSCAKRSTIGAYLLKTLSSEWTNYIDFHLNTLGCHTCRANLEDLKTQNENSDHPKALHTRIMQSSIGFF